MGLITFPIQSDIGAGGTVTVESSDILDLDEAGYVCIVSMNDGVTYYRALAPIELLQQAVANGQQPIEQLPPSDPTALAQSVWKPGG